MTPAADFIVAHGPAFGGAVGGAGRLLALDGRGRDRGVAAADIARADGDTTPAVIWRGVADHWQRSVEDWTVTTNGALASPYFIRLSKTGDPNAAISYNLGNGGPTLDQRDVIDPGFLELVRLGVLPATDPVVTESLPVVDATIEPTQRAARAGIATTATVTATVQLTAIPGRRAAREPAISGRC